jgi:hypothetical protein
MLVAIYAAQHGPTWMAWIAVIAMVVAFVGVRMPRQW